jgi:tRNA threonylcarbamoyl adenosine modification protein (Sua5/YciO/YrdC/YwlC family)
MASFHKLYEKNTNMDLVRSLAKAIKEGAVVIYPTDTVYGMGCDLHQARAVEKVCKVKGVKPEKAMLSFICNDLSHIADYAKVSNFAFKLMKRALPGPFTFVLPASSKVPKSILGSRSTVGIRIPKNPICQALVAELGNPLITTSLKEVDSPEYITDPELIFEQYQNLVDIVIDGGYGQLTASTIVEIDQNDELTILRQGLGEIEAFL